MKSKQSKFSQYFVFLKSLTNNWIMLKTVLDNSKDDIVFDNSLTVLSEKCILMHTGLFIHHFFTSYWDRKWLWFDAVACAVPTIKFFHMDFDVELTRRYPCTRTRASPSQPAASLPLPNPLLLLNPSLLPPFHHTLGICNCAVTCWRK